MLIDCTINSCWAKVAVVIEYRNQHSGGELVLDIDCTKNYSLVEIVVDI